MAKSTAEPEMAARINRIIGQCQGIGRMMEGERDCNQIIQQVVAARAALAQLGVRLLQDEAGRCFQDTDAAAAFRKMTDSIFRLT